MRPEVDGPDGQRAGPRLDERDELEERDVEMSTEMRLAGANFIKKQHFTNKNCWKDVGDIGNSCQFHQQLMRAFLVQKCSAQLFSNYILAL
jgi:hypothetical protein